MRRKLEMKNKICLRLELIYRHTKNVIDCVDLDYLSAATFIFLVANINKRKTAVI